MDLLSLLLSNTSHTTLQRSKRKRCGSSWLSRNIQPTLTPEKVKKCLPSFFGDKDTNTIPLNSDFCKYILEETFDDSDDPDKLKYNEILEEVQCILADHPGYKLPTLPGTASVVAGKHYFPSLRL
jgi:hypothetical protein